VDRFIHASDVLPINLHNPVSQTALALTEGRGREWKKSIEDWCQRKSIIKELANTTKE